MTQEIPQNNKDNTQEQTLSSSVLERIEKESMDNALNYLTLFLFEWKRYSCFNCGWQGSSSWMYRFKK